jgi:membrane-bound lytic murein transglycosylase B
LEALATHAFDYPRRAAFFRKELENYLLLTREESIDPLAVKGSYAGAMGLPQFMPSSYRGYAVDFDGDGQRNLWTNPRDAIGSVGNYLEKNGWRRDALIATPAQVEGSQYRSLISAKPVKPKYTIQRLRQQGVTAQGQVSAETRATLFSMEGDPGPEYWLGFNNFYVITRYNRSLLYALAVYQLSEAIRGLRQD